MYKIKMNKMMASSSKNLIYKVKYIKQYKWKCT